MRSPTVLRPVAALLVVCCACLLPPFSNTAVATGGDWRGKQEIWWNDAHLVKSAIVSYLKLLHDNPELHTKENPQWQILSLILVLDSHNDAQSLNTLASLAPYNLGASGSEIYACVVQRKGTKILSALQAAITSGNNECTDAMGSDSSACLKPSDYRARVQGLISAVKADRSCTIEQ